MLGYVGINSKGLNILRGYEYGIKPGIVILGDIEFSNKLMEAGFLGIAYIKIPRNILEGSVIEIALFFEHYVKGKEAFKHILNWENGNPDRDREVFEMDFVETDMNGYTLCIYQNPIILLERNIRNSLVEWITPLITNMTHFKKIDNISPQYEEFKKALQFCQVKIFAVDIEGNPILPGEYILKKKLSFYNKESGFDGKHWESILFKDEVSQESEEKQIDRLELNGNVEEVRISKIKNYLPITYEKIMSNNATLKLIEELKELYSEGQIIQAICNLILFERLKADGFADILIDSKDIHFEILEYLDVNHEEFNSYFPNFNNFSKEKIINQIKLDIEDFEKFLEG